MLEGCCPGACIQLPNCRSQYFSGTTSSGGLFVTIGAVLWGQILHGCKVVANLRGDFGDKSCQTNVACKHCLLTLFANCTCSRCLQQLFANIAGQVLLHHMPSWSAQTKSGYETGNYAIATTAHQDGQLRVTTPDRRVELSRLHVDDTFGEVECVLGIRMLATVCAVTYTTVLILTREDVDEVLEDFPELRVELEAAVGRMGLSWGWEIGC